MEGKAYLSPKKWMFHKIYNNLGDKWIMATDSGKEQEKKRDEKFLKFAREYQEKIGNSIEMQIDKPSNMEFKTISLIETRINLLLPENYFCWKEYIVCLKNPCGTWGEASNVEFYEKYNNELDEKALKEIVPKKIVKEWKKICKDQEKISCQLQEFENKEGEKLSDKASLEEAYRECERKADVIVDVLAERAVEMLDKKYPIFKDFTVTEQKLYETLLECIQSEKDKPDHINSQAIKNKGWWIVEEEKRCKIYELFSNAVKENRQKWKLSNGELDVVYRKLFCPKYNKIILEEDKALKMETPNSWIEIIRRNSKVEAEDEKEFIKNLKKLERALKKLGVTQQAADDFRTEGYRFTQDEFEKWLEEMYKEERKLDQ